MKILFQVDRQRRQERDFINQSFEKAEDLIRACSEDVSGIDIKMSLIRMRAECEAGLAYIEASEDMLKDPRVK